MTDLVNKVDGAALRVAFQWRTSEWTHWIRTSKQFNIFWYNFFWIVPLGGANYLWRATLLSKNTINVVVICDFWKVFLAFEKICRIRNSWLQSLYQSKKFSPLSMMDNQCWQHSTQSSSWSYVGSIWEKPWIQLPLVQILLNIHKTPVLGMFFLLSPEMSLYDLLEPRLFVNLHCLPALIKLLVPL